MRKVIPDELKEPLEQGRLLFISTSKAVRQSKQTALDRNKYICEVADNIFFVGVTPNIKKGARITADPYQSTNN